jgi:streptogrisin C
MKRASGVVSVLVWASLGSGCVSDEEAPRELGDELATADTLSHEQALAADARTYAQQHGVSPEEAASRLAAQSKVGHALADLEERHAGSFAGVRWSHDPFFVEVLSTAPIPDLDARIERAGAGKLELRATAVRWSLEALHARMREVAGQVGDDLTGGFIDVGANQVVLEVQPGSAARVEQLVAATLDGDSDAVRVEERDSQLAYGGLNAGCTTGFGLYDPFNYPHYDPVHYFTTAGHCDNHLDIALMGPADVIHGYEYNGGRRDYQAMYIPNVQAAGYFWDGGMWRVRSGVRGWTTVNEGDFFCKFGVTSGYTCGQLRTKYRSGAESPYEGEDFYIEIETTPPANQAQPGDSGGPWFIGGDAMGWTHGSTVQHWPWTNAIVMSVSWPLHDGWGLL